jgi:hypothetical protein
MQELNKEKNMGVAHTIPKLPSPPSIPKLKLSTPKLPSPPSIPKLLNPSTPKRPKPLRQVLPARFHRASPNKMNEAIEAYDTDITDAASIRIGSDLPMEERNALRDDFVNYIKEMCMEGRSVMAIAVAF